MCGADPRDCDSDQLAVVEKLPAELRRDLRASYRCDCVERHDRRPGRVTLPVLEQDAGEQILNGIERDTGVRPDGCPWRSLRDPFVVRVVKAHRGWKNGHAITEQRLRSAVEAYDAARNAIEVADMKAERKRDEQKRAAETPPRTKLRRPGR